MAVVEIGSFEAKTKFAELLRRVQAGDTVIVTLRGRAVAQLGAPAAEALAVLEDERHRRAQAAIAALGGAD